MLQLEIHYVIRKSIITLERMEFPEPVISVAVEPKSKADQEKMGIALQKLAQEDPSFRVNTDEETGPNYNLWHGRIALRYYSRPYATANLKLKQI